TDTGSFHYSNTTERTFKVASELVRAGVKPAKIAQAVYSNYPWSKLELMKEVLSTIRHDESGRVAWLRQTLGMQEHTNASDEDAERVSPDLGVPPDNGHVPRADADEQTCAGSEEHDVINAA